MAKKPTYEELEQRVKELGKEAVGRKQAEEARQESEERYRAIFEQAVDSVVLIDAETGTLVDFNERAHENLGYTRKEFEKFKLPDFEIIESAEEVIKHIKRIIKEGADVFETKHSTKTGEIRDIQVSSRAISIGGRDFLQSIWRDITERKRAEEELRESEQKFRNLADSSPSMIFVYQAGKVVYANQVCQDLMGYTIEGFLSPDFDFLSLIAPESLELIKDKLSKHMQGKEVTPYEYVLLTKDGERLNAIMTSRLIDYQGESAILGIITDITERKQTEEALTRLNEELLKEHNQRRILSKRLIDLLEKDRRQIAMELHDHIGQTLTSLKMNLEMIHGKLKPDHAELGAQITATQERTIQAIKDVKNISHGLRPAMIDALGVVASLRGLFNEIQQQMDIEIHFFSRGIPKRFEEEKELAIYRITQEALGNIIRHAQAKNVFVNLVKKNEKVSLSVEDDGVGFDQDKVMKPSKRKGPLGLLIMRERAVQLDGEFIIESQPGKGTNLLVEIPL